MDNSNKEHIFIHGFHNIYSNGKKVMGLQEEDTSYTTKYKVIDLVKDKYNKSFADYDNAIEYCDWCLKDGATALRLITEEYMTTDEIVSR